MVKLKLKEYLEEKKISINWLHEATEIRYATLFAIVNGHNQKINLIYLNKIMDALNISDMNIILEKDNNLEKVS